MPDYFTNGDIVKHKETGELSVCFQQRLFQIYDNTKESHARKYKASEYTKVADLREIGAKVLGSVVPKAEEFTDIGWTLYKPGDLHPRGDTTVNIKLAPGRTCYYENAPVKAKALDWGECGTATITAYKVIE